MNTPIQDLIQLGQSLWYDNVQRSLLASPASGGPSQLGLLIERGEIRGVTSNPTIFHNAIANSNDYDVAIHSFADSGMSAENIFWELAVEDIRAACDLFQPIYAGTSGGDGYVSLEVNPTLAHDSAGTVAQAGWLWRKVDRPNLMIKIPATHAGVQALRQVIAAGINVNVTLIFSLERYREVIDAYLGGLEDCLLSGGDIENIHSVASFFISRVDSKIDSKLPADSPLRGKAALANARLAYEEFRNGFSAPRFGKLQLAKANYQRPLWASTGTKNPAYSDTMYVDNLIGPATVNTLPPATLEAFRQHGRAAMTIMDGLEDGRQLFSSLEEQGISIDAVTSELEQEGVQAFEQAFAALLASIQAKRSA